MKSYTRSKFAPSGKGKFTSSGWLSEDNWQVVSQKPSLLQVAFWALTYGLVLYVVLLAIGVI